MEQVWQVKNQNLNTQHSAPSVTLNKGSSRIEETEHSLAHKWDSYGLETLNMIPVATSHKIHWSSCSTAQILEIFSQIIKQSIFEGLKALK